MVPLSSPDYISLPKNVSILSPIRRMIPLSSLHVFPLPLDVSNISSLSFIDPQDISSSLAADSPVSSLPPHITSGSHPDVALPLSDKYPASVQHQQ